MDGTSLNLTKEKLEQLKAILPEAFTEDKLDWEKLRAALKANNFSEFKDERYVLNWAGKSEAFRKLQEPNSATLVPCREESVDFDSSGHLFLEGENLEVLKVLQQAYFGKVKVIYIDPPYNTGNDFIYNDKFAEDPEGYLERIGDKDGNGFKLNGNLVRNSKESGHFHSNWLSMMYPRLYLARNLLRENGVIFVSIDDNEAHNLRLIMNEIFGEENFFATLTRKAMHTVRNSSKDFNLNADYILAYAKSKFWFEQDKSRYIRQIVDKSNNYLHDDNDGRGKYKLDPLHARNYYTPYEFTFKNGVKWSAPKGSSPRYSQITLKEMEAGGRIVFSGKEPKAKRYLSEVQEGQPPNAILNPQDVGFNADGTRELSGLFSSGGVFPQPKPSFLVKFLLSLLRNKDAIVLDFFAGSATTAHAVFDLNKEDGGNRKFIMVQMPEPCDKKSEAYKAGYKSVADIGKERIRRVIQKIKEEGNGKLDLDGKNGKQDLGFKVFKLQASNFKKWQTNIKDVKELEEQLKLHINPIQEGSSAENILYELLLKSGLTLTTKIEKKGEVYFINDNELALLLEISEKEGAEKSIEKGIQEIVARHPQKMLALDRIFEGKDQLKTNTDIQMKDAEIEFETL